MRTTLAQQLHGLHALGPRLLRRNLSQRVLSTNLIFKGGHTPNNRALRQIWYSKQQDLTLSCQTRAMSNRTSPEIDADVRALFDDFYSKFPERYREDGWYLTLASSLIAIGAPSLVGPLYKYMSEKPSFDAEQTSTRLNELFMKIFTITGISPVLGAVMPLAAAERSLGLSTDPDSRPRHSYVSAAPNSEASPASGVNAEVDLYSRGNSFLQLIYQHNLPPIVASMGRHGPEIMSMERNIIYGQYLSDFSILNEQDTELVIIAAMLCMGTRSAAEWHIRGARRVGIEWADIESTVNGVSTVAEWVLGKEIEGEGGRRDVVVGKGRGDWMNWVQEVRANMAE